MINTVWVERGNGEIREQIPDLHVLTVKYVLAAHKSIRQTLTFELFLLLLGVFLGVAAAQLWPDTAEPRTIQQSAHSSSDAKRLPLDINT